ncbi:rod shape-determining protein MreD [Pectinatus brassicae]|uniref:Rod shape-determining protein MreD n=1 Tax=Pectinatus brassicae TaxID=862415 RepID=A0A840UQP6_9FIRM|nr:rod shape-determining protein MreD [Pectinatus brassicae]MBB5337038.1 rod shape-determining protein MreD [Pectinatus brassicae]
MKKAFAWILVFLVVYILQSSLLYAISFEGSNADLLLLLTTSIALTHGFKRGAFAGFCGGLLQDIASGAFLGFNTLSKMIIGFCFGLMIDRIYEGKILLPLVSSVAATVANYIILTIIIFLLGYNVDIRQNIYKLLLFPIIYNLIFSYFVHKLVCWLKNKSFDN